MKVVKSAQHYTETALDEIKLLKCVSITHAIQCSISIITEKNNLKIEQNIGFKLFLCIFSYISALFYVLL